MPGMTDRDHFAAAALTGLLFHNHEPPKPALWWVEQAFDYADAMLRERERTNLDAAPAARAAPSESSAPLGKGLGTGDTQSFDAYAMFAGSVMNWISEATSAYAASCSSDGGRKIMADACSRCWDAFDRIAYPTVHGASPEARASVDSVAPQPTTRGESDRTDKAAPRPSEGTGDTPDSPKPIKGGVSDRLKPIASEQEPVAWGVASHFRVLATSISRMDAVDMQSDYAYHTEIVPLYRSPPVTKPMPKEKRAEVCAGPLAWAAIRENGQPLWLSYDRSGAEGMVNGMAEVFPLYRSPTLTDAEREALEFAAAHGETVDAAWRYALRGLLERMGGGR